MSASNPYIEIERKYLLRPDDLATLPAELLQAPEMTIEQYYINHPDEPYELRLRKSDDGREPIFVTTMKKGVPPVRLEVETPISQNTFEYWHTEAHTKPVHKTRKILAFAAGHWALDRFAHFDFSLLEVEGDTPQPSYGQDVTADTRFTNYQLAQLSNFMQGYVVDTLHTSPERPDISHFLTHIEHLRRRSSEPVIVGIAGATASGKTTLARELAEPYGKEVVIMSQDDYYYGATKMRKQSGSENPLNFDAPEALNTPLLALHLMDLRTGKSIHRPTYSMATSEQTGEFTSIDPSKTPLIFVEGIHALDPRLQRLYDYTIFVDAPVATRIGRRLERDLAEGRSYKPEDNLRYLLEVAEPTYQPYAAIQKSAADDIFLT